MRKKVCFLLYNLDPGGLENYLLRFLKLNEDTIEATVILKSGKGGILAEQFLNMGTKIIYVRSGYLNVRAWLKILKVFKAHDWDCVCDLTSNFAGIYMFLSKLAGVSSRVAYFGQSSNHFKQNFLNLTYNYLINHLIRRYATTVISNSVIGFNFFFGDFWKRDSRFHILSNGVDSTIFSKRDDLTIRKEFGIPDNGFVITHSGRYDEKKNHKTILNLAKSLCQLHSDIYFILCGKDTSHLNDIINKTGLKDKVFALGYRDDVQNVLNNSNLFFFPSYTEGQPNALIEAMLCELPFVASNIDSIKETIPKSCYSLLVKPDDVNSAAEIILSFYYRDFEIDTKDLRYWAVNKYDANERFREFGNLLLG